MSTETSPSWKTLSSEEIFKHPRLTLIEDEVLLPNGQKTTYLKYKYNYSHIVTVVAQRADGKILLQQEYCYPINQKIYQFPGGKTKGTETPDQGANRELMEEAQLKALDLKLLGSYLANNRRSDVRVYVYLGTKLESAALEKDAEEDTESFWYSDQEIEELITKGEIINVHTLAAWTLYRIIKQL
ncbi:MAG: NUDIX hydrolase [bacterium]|nr:NUDIX hydrolase [bacterium]